MTPIVVVGAGMAGARLVEELVARGVPGAAIVAVGGEAGGTYDRIALSHWLQGTKSRAEIVTHPPEWFAARGVRLIDGVGAIGLDRAGRALRLADGSALRYGRLALALGARPLTPPIPGIDLPGVVAYRTAGDVAAMIAAARPGRRAVVIGGGLLGLEAAWGLKLRGMAVTIVHLMPWPMERQLDAEGGATLAAILRARGIALRLAAQTQTIAATEDGLRLRFADDATLDADLVCLAAGIRPETALAAASGLEVRRGIVADARCLTADPDVAAIGECAEVAGTCVGLVAPAWEQAAVAAASLTGGAAAWTPRPPETRLKASGVDVFSVGAAREGEGVAVARFADPAAGLCRRLFIKDGRLVGALQVGFADDAPWYARLVAEGRPLGALRQEIILGRAAAEAGERIAA